MPDEPNTGHPLTGYLPVQENTLLARTVCADVPRIETLGILSASNPDGQPLPAAENHRRFQDLYRDLVVYGMRQVRGTFDGFVHPLIVANVARTTLMGLGAKYGHARLVFGQRQGEAEKALMRFKMLEPDLEEAGGQDRVVAMRTAYVQAHGHRAEDEEHHAKESARPFVIPGFDLPPDAPDAEFRGARVFSYRREDIPATPEAQEALKRFLARDRLLVETLSRVERGENFTAHYVYDRCGDQNLRLIELHELLGN